MLPWFEDDQFPIYLAPMAGVTDLVFRQLCKELGADVMVTEFASAEGIIRKDERTRVYTEFTESQRPLGVQLFGANPQNLAEAAKKIIDWRQPDFIDLNFGCPVNKVVSKNGGSSLLKDCPTLAAVASTVAKSVPIPVTAKIRIGWDQDHVNAVAVTTMLEDCGMQAVVVHGRTRSQGYGGLANWDVIDACSQSVRIPVVGNGDLASGKDVELRRGSTGVKGVMIGRAAMGYPWVFQEAKQYLRTGCQSLPVSVNERWAFILRHCRLQQAATGARDERRMMQSMRSRLMAYSKGFPGGRHLRQSLSAVASLMELEGIAEEHLAELERRAAA